jgi:hypothetical protein
VEQSKQLVSRELAEKMKDKGFVQRSLCYWEQVTRPYKGSSEKWKLRLSDYDIDDEAIDLDTVKYTSFEDNVSAYSVAELGEMLEKANMKHTTFVKAYLKVMDLSWDDLGNYDGLVQICINLMTQPDIPAQMLIWLVEQKLINPKEIKT